VKNSPNLVTLVPLVHQCVLSFIRFAPFSGVEGVQDHEGVGNSGTGRFQDGPGLQSRGQVSKTLLINVQIRVAKFFTVAYQTGKNIGNRHKMYQMDIKYTKCLWFTYNNKMDIKYWRFSQKTML
jgi:hypothetical protein